MYKVLIKLKIQERTRLFLDFAEPIIKNSYMVVLFLFPPNYQPGDVSSISHLNARMCQNFQIRILAENIFSNLQTNFARNLLGDASILQVMCNSIQVWLLTDMWFITKHI
jgi:hypothetical protein